MVKNRLPPSLEKLPPEPLLTEEEMGVNHGGVKRKVGKNWNKIGRVFLSSTYTYIFLNWLIVRCYKL